MYYCYTQKNKPAYFILLAPFLILAIIYDAETFSFFEPVCCLQHKHKEFLRLVTMAEKIRQIETYEGEKCSKVWLHFPSQCWRRPLPQVRKVFCMWGQIHKQSVETSRKNPLHTDREMQFLTATFSCSPRYVMYARGLEPTHIEPSFRTINKCSDKRLYRSAALISSIGKKLPLKNSSNVFFIHPFNWLLRLGTPQQIIVRMLNLAQVLHQMPFMMQPSPIYLGLGPAQGPYWLVPNPEAGIFWGSLYSSPDDKKNVFPTEPIRGSVVMLYKLFHSNRH